MKLLRKHEKCHRKDSGVFRRGSGTLAAITVAGVAISVICTPGIAMAETPIIYVESEAQETEAESVEYVPYTDNDLEVLAHLICGEAQNCSDEEQLYVGSVVLNRVAHKSYPDTIEGVVFQKGQYACTWDGNYDREPTERNWANAAYLLDNGSVLPEDVIYQAGFKQGSGVYIKTKHHYYCHE